ncbi:MAG: hypothetical protein QF685_05565, partial [Verrucomicrobiota bacterium]|nr:hypothetical protein [Verrucomicrobiota bacterium]
MAENLGELKYCSEDPLNFSESGWWGRIFSAMKVLIPILIGLLVVGCGKKQFTNTNEGNSTPIKTAKKKSATPLTPEEQKALREKVIVENGKPRAEIIIAEKPARAAQFGAQELQTYLEKISGARIKIVTEPTADAQVKIYVGESEHARDIGITAKGLKRDAFKMVSGANWLALVGNDLEFEPREPWARHHGQWAQEKQSEWDKITRKPWMNPIGRRLYRNYNKQLDLWNFDHRGSLNA